MISCNDRFISHHNLLDPGPQLAASSFQGVIIFYIRKVEILFMYLTCIPEKPLKKDQANDQAIYARTSTIYAFTLYT
jgi:hypothetical protein